MHERLNINRRPEPQIEVRKTGQYLKLTHAGIEHCIEVYWLMLDSLNLKQPDRTKWTPRPIPSA
jgi:hypothetical protein